MKDNKEPTGPYSKMTKKGLARLYQQKSSSLTPLARSVYSLIYSYGHITALDAIRGPLGINSGSLTRRLTELREAGFPVKREEKQDKITKRKYSRWSFDIAE